MDIASKVPMDWVHQLNGIMENYSFNLPLAHVLFLLIGIAMFMIWGKFKTGLLASFVFLFYTSYVDHRVHVIDMFGGETIGTVLYVFSGISALILFFVSMCQEEA